MAVAKVTEISASSPQGFEDAIQAGITRAARTLEHIRGAWLKDLKVVVENGRVTEYRVRMKVTFVLKD
ncbi:MAG TPA: dodecin family protein [Gemmatimonadales bacterium]|jgi:flavin-binding protein dodecin|nr:dodecin family protein [Gemmatimonadales bacterium]